MRRRARSVLTTLAFAAVFVASGATVAAPPAAGSHAAGSTAPA